MALRVEESAEIMGNSSISISIHLRACDGNIFIQKYNKGGDKWSGETGRKLLQLPIIRLNKSPNRIVSTHPKPVEYKKLLFL